MEITLPADLSSQVDYEVSSGHFRGVDELVTEALRQFLDDRRRAQERIDALRRIGAAVDEAGLYERVLIPNQE